MVMRSAAENVSPKANLRPPSESKVFDYGEHDGIDYESQGPVNVCSVHFVPPWTLLKSNWSRHTMSLTVSMEDTELFPKDQLLNMDALQSFEHDFDTFKQMKDGLDRLWWSRLVISVRGYVINYVHSNDNTLFHCDDAFITIHRYLAETTSDTETAHKYFVAVGKITSEKNLTQRLLAVAMRQRPNENPLEKDDFLPYFEQVFGTVNPITIQVAIGQLPAYIVFARVYSTLQRRWKEEKAKKRGIRFETDPEWEPDERVVLFQQFGSGNRTWILLDFDRYIIAQWKPKGCAVIFGDRFVEKKKRAGLKLCKSCGMLEQQVSQFFIHNGEGFCSKECFDSSTEMRGATIVQL